MARTILNSTLRSTLGLLSAAVFFAAFVLVGDIVIAAAAALAVGVSQLVLGLTSHRGVNTLTWASLALVIALTGLSLMGEDGLTAADSAARLSKTSLECGCQPSNADGILQMFHVKDVNI